MIRLLFRWLRNRWMIKLLFYTLLLTQAGCTFMVHTAGSVVGNVLSDVVIEKIKKDNKKEIKK